MEHARVEWILCELYLYVPHRFPLFLLFARARHTRKLAADHFFNPGHFDGKLLTVQDWKFGDAEQKALFLTNCKKPHPHPTPNTQFFQCDHRRLHTTAT